MRIDIKDNRKKFLSDKMFGLFFEDINYAADGGLYAEMIENRQFSFRKSFYGKAPKTYDSIYAGDYGYEKYPISSGVSMSFVEGNSLSEMNPHYMNVTTTEANTGFTNKAYDGICMKKDKAYKLTVFLRTDDKKQQIKFQVHKATKCYDKTGNGYNCGTDFNDATTHDDIIVAEVTKEIKASKEWIKYDLVLTASQDVKNGLFVVTQDIGSVDYGYISLMPEDAVAGVFRRDLFDMIDATKPGFLRFPGGCIVEGANLSNRYRWKDTIGLPWNRKWNWSRWAVHDVTMGQGEPLFYPFYNQSYGIGFYEYFVLAELIGAKALPVLNVGLACQFQSDELVPVESEEFKEYIQDALDLVEFANGEVTTKWGAIRAEMGHPEPFALEYIGIGNEQWETETVDFFARYSAFEKAIHDVYPEIELLGSAGPDVTSEKYTGAWNFYREEFCKGKEKSVVLPSTEYRNNEVSKNSISQKNAPFTAAVDEHYYMPPAWFYEHVNMYDDYSRDIPVFAGEYAAHTANKENNMEAALAEAAFMCGLEKNCDVIRFASAAPLFARQGYVQWIPDYIWFDGDTVMGTPGYYVQKMFGAYTGNESVDFSHDAGEKIYVAVSADTKKDEADNEIYYIKIINAGTEATCLNEISIVGKLLKLNDCNVLQMSANDESDKNILGENERITLKEINADKDGIIIPKLSCTVIVVKR